MTRDDHPFSLSTLTQFREVTTSSQRRKLLSCSFPSILQHSNLLDQTKISEGSFQRRGFHKVGQKLLIKHTVAQKEISKQGLWKSNGKLGRAAICFEHSSNTIVHTVVFQWKVVILPAPFQFPKVALHKANFHCWMIVGSRFLS
jgi:hypothetical protein